MLRGTALSQQLASAGLIATCLALQLAGTVHLTLVEHELCAEHGEAVDVSDPHAHHHGSSSASRSISEVRSDDGPDSHGGPTHEHCSQVEDRSGRALLVPCAFAGVRAPSFLATVPAPRATWRLSANALRLLAPKTSPPV